MTDTPAPKTPNPLSLDLDFGKQSLTESLLSAMQSAFSSLKHGYVTTADMLVDEVLAMMTEQQVNDALQSFVTDNVDALLNLRMELHDDWLRLYGTLDVKGIFASVACNFRLVQGQASYDTQRFVFEQLSDTEIITLHSKSWWQGIAIKWGVGLYRTLLRKDPLPFILNQIIIKREPFAMYKGNYIYLDIHRYVFKLKELNYLKKAQVNTASTKEGKLLLSVEPIFSEILSFGDSGEDIITEKDDPNRKKDKS